MAKIQRIPCDIRFNGKLVFTANDLVAEDLDGKDHNVTIENVTMRSFPGESKGDPPQERLVLTFVNRKKRLVLSAKVQLVQIKGATGCGSANEWKGKAITIYPTTCSAFGDPRCPCIRIRPKAPTTQAATKATDPDEPPFGGEMSDEDRDRILAEEAAQAGS